MSLIMPNMQQGIYPRPVQEQGESSLGVHSLVQAIVRHRRLGLTIFLAVVSLVAVFTFTSTKMYESEMNILVQNARGTLVVTPERTIPSPMASGVTEEQVNSEMELLRSKELAEAVVDPHWNPAGQSAAAIKAHEKAVTVFRGHLTIDAIRKSNVIHVAVRAKSPAAAQAQLRTLLAAYLAKERDIERPTGASSFFAGQADQYKDQLEETQRQLAALQQQTGVVSLPETEANLEQQVSDLQGDQRSTDLQLVDAEDRLKATRRELSSVPNRQRTLERTVPFQLSIEQLNTQLEQLKIKREELSTKFVPSDRLVLENQREIDQTTAALSGLRSSSAQETSTDVNPVWQQLFSAAAVTTAEITGLQGKRSSLEGQIGASQARLAALEGQTVQFATLKQRVAELESAYQLYTQKRDEAQIADAMDQQKMLNVAVAEAPTLSFVQVRPKPVSDLLLGGLTALFLACGAIFYAEISRATVSSARELEAASTYPVLATIPLQALGTGPGQAAAAGRRDAEYQRLRHNPS